MTANTKHRIPSIIGVGPGRTGTTWLHQMLEGRVDLPYGVKETQFFSHFYDHGIEWYAHHFRYATGDRPVAEICPPYFLKPECLERIKLHIPDCRIITTMRDPVERVYSVYKHLRHTASARSGTFDQIFNTWPSLAGGNRYAFHLKAWFENFGRENVLVTFYDELRAEPRNYLNRVTDFMGVQRIVELPQIGNEVNAATHAPRNRRLARRALALEHFLRSHQAYGVINLLDRTRVWEFCRGRGELFPPLTPEQDARLRARYLPEVEALEELLKIDLSAWKKPRASRTVETPSPRLQQLARG
jgi:hypothetical protein